MNWDTALSSFMASDAYNGIKTRVKADRESGNVYPDSKSVFRALTLCPLDKVRVVIFGQDPYHTPDTADGLAFSSLQDKRPPSLEVIFKEAYNDLAIKQSKNKTYEEFFSSNSLENWTKLGFLLLNTSMTVKEGDPDSHGDIGWSYFIAAIIEALNLHAKRRIVFLLWGKRAQSLIPLIDDKKHMYFQAPHPAAELYDKKEQTFTGCGHFSLVRDIVCSLMSENNANDEFDTDKIIKVITERYPGEYDRISSYMERGFIFRKRINSEAFNKNISTFENLLST
jgi:uracil-DNA glycosylase